MRKSFELGAETRDDQGKGASRRLRHTGKVPAILYGGHGEPRARHAGPAEAADADREREVLLVHHQPQGRRQDQQAAIVKDMQMHPATQRHRCTWTCSACWRTRRSASTCRSTSRAKPLRPGVKTPGRRRLAPLTDVEITCLPKDLPEFIEVDLSQMEPERDDAPVGPHAAGGRDDPGDRQGQRRGRRRSTRRVPRSRSRPPKSLPRRLPKAPRCSGRRCAGRRREAGDAKAPLPRATPRRCRSGQEGRRQEVSRAGRRGRGSVPLRCNTSRCPAAADRLRAAPPILFIVRRIRHGWQRSQTHRRPRQSRAPTTRARATTPASGWSTSWRARHGGTFRPKPSTRRSWRASASAATSSGWLKPRTFMNHSGGPVSQRA